MEYVQALPVIYKLGILGIFLHIVMVSGLDGWIDRKVHDPRLHELVCIFWCILGIASCGVILVGTIGSVVYFFYQMFWG